MTTKNLSKSFKGKINGQHLPSIPITDDTLKQTATNANLPNSILKKSKPFTEDRTTGNHRFPLDDDDLDTSRTICQKSQVDMLLLLDTYPPKTWSISKCLTASHENTLGRGRAVNPILDTLLASADQHGDLIDAFPSPLSDRLPSSRYCRRSVSSSCSRRSSILFQRHTGIPVDSKQLRREETFDTFCESLTDTLGHSYTPLPPITTDSSANLTKSLTNPTTDLPWTSVDPPSNLTQSLLTPPTDLLPSLSPPLITPEDTPAIQEKKEEFTRRLLSKSLHRESSGLSTDKTMHSSTVIQKPAMIKPVVIPRIQKPVVDNRRVNSVDRQPPAASIRNKLPTTTSSVSMTNTNHPTLKKLPLDIFQPQVKFNTTTTPATTKKPTIVNSKAKTSAKINVPKVKLNAALPDEETVQSNNDVIPSLSPPVSAPIEAPQVTNIDKIEDLPSPVVNAETVLLKTEPSTSDSPVEPKYCPCSRASSRYSNRPSHPVPKPLTLQGEKIVDADYPQTTTRTVASSMVCGGRRGSLKGQPVIIELFSDSVVDPHSPIVKPPPPPPAKPFAMKLKKSRPAFVKSAKPKKAVIDIKPKIPAILPEKVEVRCQSTNTEEAPEEKKPSENLIVVGGTDWMMAVKPQMMNDDESVLSQMFDPSTVEEEDLPSCTSPTDQLTVSQSTMMTSIGDLQRRDSIGSEQAFEISPVLTQTIERHVEITPESSLRPAKPNESSLLNSDIRTVYDTVRDSIRKDASLRSLPLQSIKQENASVKPSSLTSTSSDNKTLPFEATGSVTHTYNNSDTGLSIRPALRVVNDSLNSRGSETIDSTSSHEDYSGTLLCTENDCDEICRTARKGRQVGRGAFGIVWSCLTTTGRMIAVKEIELDEGDSERGRDDYESVRQEINILRALTHPYIVKFLGISLENTRLIKIFMEYLPNGTIENMLTQFGPFHNDVLKIYTRQIVEGVAYLHDNGVVHRDIKGKNIMLDVNGNIKLIDFGCAKRLKKNQNTHSMRHLLKSMKGTANWMAPEVIAETGHGKKADIWSIGCTLCEMATGRPPWSSEHNHLAVLLIIANGTKPPADLPMTCSVAAQDFFRLCLTRDPTLRPSARELLLHPFLAS